MPIELWQGLLTPFAGTTLGAACVFFCGTIWVRWYSVRSPALRRGSWWRLPSGACCCPRWSRQRTWGDGPLSPLYGTLSGAVEPIGAILTILLAGILVPVLPYALSFAAGAMVYVVVEELIPEMSVGKHSNIGTILFAVGFTLMMTLDVALGA